MRTCGTPHGTVRVDYRSSLWNRSSRYVTVTDSPLFPGAYCPTCHRRGRQSRFISHRLTNGARRRLCQPIASAVRVGDFIHSKNNAPDIKRRRANTIGRTRTGAGTAGDGRGESRHGTRYGDTARGRCVHGAGIKHANNALERIGNFAIIIRLTHLKNVELFNYKPQINKK